MENQLPESVTQPMTEQAVGLIDRIKVWFAGLGIMQRLQEHKQFLIELSIFFVAGLVLGFIIKRYLKYILLLVLFVVTLVILDQFNIINIGVNWPKIQDLLNIRPGFTLDEGMLATYVAWIQANVWAVLSTSLGFLIGLKLG
jgi:uncharacterized membrane protein (Fun14 family)